MTVCVCRLGRNYKGSIPKRTTGFRTAGPVLEKNPTCDKHLYEKRKCACAVFTVKPLVDPALSLIENSVMSLRL